jgi:CRP-like cAMP-binding protein
LERSEVVRVPFDGVRHELQVRPELLWDVAALLARRLRAVSAALTDAMLLDVTGRTAKRLLEIAGGADEFALPITQEELAGLVGASRERVNKAIAAFVRLGWLDQTERRYRVVNRERLAQRAG